MQAKDILPYRQRSGKSQAAVAKALGVSQSTIARLEAGATPRKPLAYRLLKFRTTPPKMTKK